MKKLWLGLLCLLASLDAFGQALTQSTGVYVAPATTFTGPCSSGRIGRASDTGTTYRCVNNAWLTDDIPACATSPGIDPPSGSCSGNPVCISRLPGTNSLYTCVSGAWTTISSGGGSSGGGSSLTNYPSYCGTAGQIPMWDGTSLFTCGTPAAVAAPGLQCCTTSCDSAPSGPLGGNPFSSCDSTTLHDSCITYGGYIYTCDNSSGSPTWTQVGSGGSPQSYLLYAQGGTYHISGNGLGATDSDACALIQQAINTSTTDPFTISLTPGTTYACSTTAKFLRNATGWQRIDGNGATIQLQTNNAAFGVNRITDGDTFQYIDIRNLTVDGNSKSVTNGVAFNSNDQRINFQYLNFANITAYNIGTNSSVIWVSPIQLGDGETARSIKNVTVKDVTATGGQSAVVIAASHPLADTSPWNYTYVLDNITIQNVYHVFDASHPSGTTVQVGSLGKVNHTLIDNVYSSGSGDNGIEVDGAQDAVIRNINCVNPVVDCITLNNFSTPTEPRKTKTTIDGVAVTVTTGTPAVSSSRVIDVVGSRDFNTIDISNVQWFRDDGDGPQCVVNVLASSGSMGIRNLSLTNFRTEVRGLAYSGSGAKSFNTICLNPDPTDLTGDGTADEPSNISLKNVYMRAEASRGGSGTLDIYGVYIARAGAKINLTADNVQCDWKLTGSFSGERSPCFEFNSSPTVKASISNLRVTDSGTTRSPYNLFGAYIGSTVNAASTFRFTQPDFTGLGSTNTNPDIWNNGWTTDPTKIVIVDPKWKSATTGLYATFGPTVVDTAATAYDLDGNGTANSADWNADGTVDEAGQALTYSLKAARLTVPSATGTTGVTHASLLAQARAHAALYSSAPDYYLAPALYDSYGELMRSGQLGTGTGEFYGTQNTYATIRCYASNCTNNSLCLVGTLSSTSLDITNDGTIDFSPGDIIAVGDPFPSTGNPPTKRTYKVQSFAADGSCPGGSQKLNIVGGFDSTTTPIVDNTTKMIRMYSNNQHFIAGGDYLLGYRIGYASRAIWGQQGPNLIQNSQQHIKASSTAPPDFTLDSTTVTAMGWPSVAPGSASFSCISGTTTTGDCWYDNDGDGTNNSGKITSTNWLGPVVPGETYVLSWWARTDYGNTDKIGLVYDTNGDGTLSTICQHTLDGNYYTHRGGDANWGWALCTIPEGAWKVKFQYIRSTSSHNAYPAVDEIELRKFTGAVTDANGDATPDWIEDATQAEYLINDPGDRPIIYTGDSWAEDTGTDTHGRSFVLGLQAALNARLGRTPTVKATGTSGYKASDVISNFYSMIEKYEPLYVVISIGNNEINSGSSSDCTAGSPVTEATFLKNLRTLVTMVQNIGAIPIVIGINPTIRKNHTDDSQVCRTRMYTFHQDERYMLRNWRP